MEAQVELTLKRATPIAPDALPGELFLDGAHAAWTLERLSVAIPTGVYPLTLHQSPHFGRLMPMLENVPERQFILIHWGNHPANSEGCILVGEMQDPSTGDVINSVKKWNELFPAIEAAVEGEGCSISVS